LAAQALLGDYNGAAVLAKVRTGGVAPRPKDPLRTVDEGLEWPCRYATARRDGRQRIQVWMLCAC